ncbi:MAG: hypothetical protein QNJ32_14345 [Xenococcaceae cyanobacterium MO_167.B27]|nr:hypothetical protein [Xenococcaceae cyanobacterium MO_167.B27]
MSISWFPNRRSLFSESAIANPQFWGTKIKGGGTNLSERFLTRNDETFMLNNFF